jgi:phosphoglycolate phosphatase
MASCGPYLPSRISEIKEISIMPAPPEDKTAVPAAQLNVKAVFFDFEGTLVDFQWQLKPAVEESLEALSGIGFKREWYGSDPSYAYLYNHTRKLSLESKGEAGLAADMAVIDRIYDKYDADALTRWNLYPDTLETLTALDRMGFQLGLISNIGRSALDAAIQRLDLSGRISVVISRDEVNELKPSPEGLLRAAAACTVEPGNCIFIGDSRNDVGAARKAGMLAAYLSGGEDTPEDMTRQPADVEIDRLSRLPAILHCIDSHGTM